MLVEIKPAAATLAPEPRLAAPPALALAAPDQSLNATITRLRRDLADVRGAMVHQSVIEQAKGVLAGRRGTDVDEAFDLISVVAARTGRRLEEIAAGIVGHLRATPAADHPAAPAPPETLAYVVDQAERAGSAAPGVVPDAKDRSVVALELAVARLSAAANADELLNGLMTYQAAWPGTQVGVIYVVEPDGALRLAAWRGLPPDVAAQWARIPPQVEVPVAVAARRRAPVWVPDGATLLRRYPIFHSLQLGFGAVAAVPLVVDHRMVGVIAFAWAEPMAFDAAQRHHLSVLAIAAGRRLVRVAPEQPLGSGIRDAAVLDGIPDPAMLLSPVIEDGEIVDMRVDHANAAAVVDPPLGYRDLVGRTLVEMMPAMATQLLVPEAVQVLRTGWPARLDRVHATADGRRTVVFTAWITRLHERTMVVWREHTAAELLHDQLLESERAAGIGSFRLRVDTGALAISPHLHRLVGSDSTAATVPWRDRPRSRVHCGPGGARTGREPAGACRWARDRPGQAGRRRGRRRGASGRRPRSATRHLPPHCLTWTPCRRSTRRGGRSPRADPTALIMDRRAIALSEMSRVCP